MNFKDLLKGKQNQPKKSAVIYSAALQDHFVKKFTSNIDIDFIKKRKQQPRKKTLTKLPSIKNKIDQKIQKLQSDNKKSILPYEDQFLKKLKQSKSDQEKIQKYNQKLTWAQKLGIIEAPPLPMTSEDWQKIQEKSKARNDSDNVCSICLQDFKIEPQVILSCSHVFHLKCLSSYQRHNKVKCCPICRHRDYEKKVIDEAIRAFTLKSIVRIQRVFRGSVERINFYSKLVEEGYKAISVRFNRRLIGFKMWRLSRKISNKVKKDKEFYSKMIENIREKNQKTNEQIFQQMIEVQRKKITDSNKIEQYLQEFGIHKKQNKQNVQKHNWQQTLKKAVSREQNECAICLAKLWGKPVYILSCTHMFHVNCIQSFERYAVIGNQNKCPCCRSQYSKKLIKQMNQK